MSVAKRTALITLLSEMTPILSKYKSTKYLNLFKYVVPEA
ncbi:hypothetical protein GCM10010123_46520 [Pilimelia anulata]|uniref:Uncharacterized protein n=1 Tax=Pilimelia anulata TaxID=53371 RepID=A0A8J3BFW8_9ACTN|nr:hypothetical protein GCM10010123_46520 [Pilimelia anulata]